MHHCGFGLYQVLRLIPGTLAANCYSHPRCCWAQMTRCCPTSWTTPPSSTGSVCVERRGCATNTWTSVIWRTSSESLRWVGKERLWSLMLVHVAVKCIYSLDTLCDFENQNYWPGRNSSVLSPQSSRMRLVVTDGVFSMDGDVAPLQGICDLAEQYRAMVFIDECHATGFLGPRGRWEFLIGRLLF